MARYFILIKRGKKMLGAIPGKAGVGKERLMSSIKGRFKKGFTGRVISELTLKKLLLRLKPNIKRRSVKRKVKRVKRKVKRKVRRVVRRKKRR